MLTRVDCIGQNRLSRLDVLAVASSKREQMREVVRGRRVNPRRRLPGTWLGYRSGVYQRVLRSVRDKPAIIVTALRGRDDGPHEPVPQGEALSQVNTSYRSRGVTSAFLKNQIVIDDIVPLSPVGSRGRESTLRTVIRLVITDWMEYASIEVNRRVLPVLTPEIRA